MPLKSDISYARAWARFKGSQTDPCAMLLYHTGMVEGRLRSLHSLHPLTSAAGVEPSSSASYGRHGPGLNGTGHRRECPEWAPCRSDPALATTENRGGRVKPTGPAGKGRPEHNWTSEITASMCVLPSLDGRPLSPAHRSIQRSHRGAPRQALGEKAQLALPTALLVKRRPSLPSL